MISPDGQSGDVPSNRVQDAVNAGFKTAVVMTAPDGSMGYVPHDRAMDAIKAGFKIGQPSVNGFQQQAPQQPGAMERGVSSFGAALGAPSKIGDYIDGPVYALKHPIDSAKLVLGAMGDAEQQTIDKAYLQQHSPGFLNKMGGVETGIYSQLPLVGPMLSHAADQIDSGDVAGGIGTTLGTVAPMILGSPEARGNIASGASAAMDAVKGIPESLNASRVAAIKATIPQAMKMPAKAVLGAEGIFKAAAPVGSDPQFRANLYNAAGDLAEIGRNVDLDAAKGGIRNPDMRVRATVNAINDYLSNMYQNEKLPQIQRNADVPVQLPQNEDAAVGIDYLSRNAGKAADRALAAKAATGQPLTLAEANQLAETTNKELLGFESMTPAERAAGEATSKKFAGLKALDQTLGNTIDQQLRARGEDGIGAYEQRYATLSAVRDQLQKRMNATELNVRGPVKTVVKPIAGAITGGKSGIASASQAAVADVNIGMALQKGFAKLAESGLQPKRVGVAPVAPTQ